MWQYYKTAWPGKVQVLGADVLDGTIAQLNLFKSQSGVTYPLMRDCYVSFSHPENFWRYYGERDHFAVVDQQGIVRYNSALLWPYGQGYKLSEIRACVDSLLTQSVAVEGALPLTFALAAAPNPARGSLTVTLASPRELDACRVAVHDLAGRRMATLWDGPLPAGRRELTWDVRDDAAARVAPGMYLVLADAGGTRFTRRIVVVH
ncbi:MAG: FlgD immunoglobulin-like domain containing protein [Candidatus Eisenbacteria bacterium]